MGGIAQKEKKKRIIAVMILIIAAGIAWIAETLSGQQMITQVERNEPGGGSLNFRLEALVDGKKEMVHLKIGEREYREDELEEALIKAKQWLDEKMRGENQSLEHVTKSLCFVKKIEGMPFTVEWVPKNYQWILSDGSITKAAITQAPVSTVIDVRLLYGDYEKRYSYHVTIENDDSENEAFKESKIESLLEVTQAEYKSDSVVQLPDTVDGKPISWSYPSSQIWLKIPVLGFGVLVADYIIKKEQRERVIKKRNIGLDRDYPDIVYRLILLIGSGLTVRASWEKIVEDYKIQKEKQNCMQWGYEEMEETVREMSLGTPELVAYERFGQRCGLNGYIRLSELLIQQVRRGARRMNHLLAQEVTETEIYRREMARQKAEEAGMQLLIPMVLLMLVVFAVLIIPAFMSMNI